MDLSDWPKPVPEQTRLEAWGSLNGMLAHAFAPIRPLHSPLRGIIAHVRCEIILAFHTPRG